MLTASIPPAAEQPRLFLVEDDPVTESIEAFFARYQAAFNRALVDADDLDVFSTSFAESFITANPNGVACWRNDDDVLSIMRQKFELYRSLGAKAARIGSLAVTALDATHSVVKARWEMLFARKGGGMESVADDVFYLVQTIDGEPRIFSYIAPDERQLFRERDLIRSA